MNLFLLLHAIVEQTEFFNLSKAISSREEKTNFILAVLRLRIDIVLHLVHGKRLNKYIQYNRMTETDGKNILLIYDFTMIIIHFGSPAFPAI